MITPYSNSSAVLPMGYPAAMPQPSGATAMIPTMPPVLPASLSGLNIPPACNPAPTTPPNSAVNIQVFANTPGAPSNPSPAAYNNSNSLAQALLANAGQPMPGSLQQVAQDIYQRALISQLQAQRDASTYGNLMNQLQGLSAANPTYAQPTPVAQAPQAFTPGLQGQAPGAYGIPQGQLYQPAPLQQAPAQPANIPQPTSYDPYGGQLAGLGAYPAVQGQPIGQIPSAQSPFAQPVAYDPYGTQMAGLGAYGAPQGGGMPQPFAQQPTPFQPSPLDPYSALGGQAGLPAGNPLSNASPEQMVASLQDPNTAGQALAEIAGRGRVDKPEAYAAIANIIKNPSDPNRLQALQTLGQLNAGQNSTLNRVQDIPGF
ncbi:MAG: hypothetical protein VKK59_01830, partial [Vampirovibrionales bacterium]|nr:hypothetical protein [Vampirovibrionales bacterium]